MKRLEESRLYGILDLQYVPPSDIVAMTQAMVEGGVDIVQLRAKQFIPDDIRWFAGQIHEVTSEAGVPLIINDFPEVAAAVQAEGVHLGQDDMPVERARSIAGYRAAVGKSTHSVAQAMAAAAEDTDYIAFGPLFATPTKPDAAPVGVQEIQAVCEMVKKPVFCIGGIKVNNLEAVIQAGAKRVVIVSGILTAQDVGAYCRKLKEMLG